MIVKTWNDGSHSDSGYGYGVRIKRTDRNKFFDRDWNNVIIHIGKLENSVEIPILDTFWTTCNELRSAKIGKYLIENKLNIWEKGKPYKLLLFHQEYNKFILIISNPRKLPTWAEGSTFTYDGNVGIGTRIYFGKDGCIDITKQQYQSLLNEYGGMTVNIGTSRDKASTQSLGYWVQENITKTAIASYVGRILLEEGYAEKVEGSMIRLNMIK